LGDPPLVEDDEFRVLVEIDVEAVLASESGCCGRNLDLDPSSDFPPSECFFGGRSSLKKRKDFG
jgi:hypothetical protein